MPCSQEICDSDGFKERYQKKWHVRVHLTDQASHQKVYSLLRTRTIGDVKGLYEVEFGLVRTDYMILRLVPGTYMTENVVPTAQSSLGGMTKEISPRHDSRLLMLTAFGSPPGSRPMTHWFANGEAIELSE